MLFFQLSQTSVLAYGWRMVKKLLHTRYRVSDLEPEEA